MHAGLGFGSLVSAFGTAAAAMFKTEALAIHLRNGDSVSLAPRVTRAGFEQFDSDDITHGSRQGLSQQAR